MHASGTPGEQKADRGTARGPAQIGFAAMYAVILAGGGGTRLWPLSRPETPKPFLPLLGERSLLQLTVDRLAGHPELALTLADITIVTDRRYARLVQAQIPRVRIVAEPAGRNP